jgi:hypothetical protein
MLAWNWSEANSSIGASAANSVGAADEPHILLTTIALAGRSNGVVVVEMRTGGVGLVWSLKSREPPNVPCSAYNGTLN